MSSARVGASASSDSIRMTPTNSCAACHASVDSVTPGPGVAGARNNARSSSGGRSQSPVTAIGASDAAPLGRSASATGSGGGSRTGSDCREGSLAWPLVTSAPGSMSATGRSCGIGVAAGGAPDVADSAAACATAGERSTGESGKPQWRARSASAAKNAVS